MIGTPHAYLTVDAAPRLLGLTYRGRMQLKRKGRVMLVTGASGFLGRHVVRRAISADWEVISPSSRSMDITDRPVTMAAITESKPDVVVHLAYRRPDRRVIVDGTRHVAEAAATAGSRFVHLSTDVVFAGRPLAYVEADEPDPIIEYGRDKADAELAVATAAPDAAIIRTSLLYGTADPSPFQLDLVHGVSAGTSPMTFFSDEFRCPVHADDLAAAILRIATDSSIAGPLHVAGPERVSRVDYAAALAQHAGLGSILLPTSTIADSGMTRAANVVLDTSLAAQHGIECRTLGDALTI
jgi:dTDP-4-dehydrorhamnose reductase